MNIGIKKSCRKGQLKKFYGRRIDTPPRSSVELRSFHRFYPPLKKVNSCALTYNAS